MSYEGAVTGDGFADDQILHLIGTFVGVQRLRIGEEARDIVVGDDAIAAQDLAAVCTENLNPNVLTMKSAQYGARIYDAGSLNLARDRRIFVQ